MTSPITPKQAREAWETSIPDEVFEVFNTIISEKYNSNGFTILQSLVVDQLLLKMPHVKDSQEFFDKHWLDIEPMYRKAGWDVTYDKPGYNETYEASWEFKPKK